MKHRLATLVILALAVALYAVGMSRGASALLVVGGAFELLFWVRVTRRGKPKAGSRAAGA